MDDLISKILPDLRCPERREPLRDVSEAELERLNAAIRAGSLCNVGGQKVEEELGSALVRESGDLAYPVRDGIPILIVEEGLLIPGA